MPHPKREEQMDRRTAYFDVDDTLLMHNLSNYDIKEHVTIYNNFRTFKGVPNKKTIRLLAKFYGLGYEIVVWSKTGKSWAEAVGTELGLSGYFPIYMTKPDFYVDDREPSEWLGTRIVP